MNIYMNVYQWIHFSTSKELYLININYQYYILGFTYEKSRIISWKITFEFMKHHTIYSNIIFGVWGPIELK